MTNREAGARESRRRELGTFLRAQRARLTPSDVGLPSGPGHRRTPGLRREEVAQLSGVGLTWYTWLEQARPIPASAQVVDALASALRLGPDQHRYLRVLADLPPLAPEAVPAAALPRLQRLVDATAPAPAAVYDVHYDYLVWNTPYVRVRHDPAAVAKDLRNLLWLLFTDPQIRASMQRWESAARAILSQFRTAAGQRTGDARFAEMVTALADASPEFRMWWAEYPVRSFAPTTISINHPKVGSIRLELFQLHPVEHPEALLVMQVPASNDDRRRISSLLG
jgi:hypothetical protein